MGEQATADTGDAACDRKSLKLPAQLVRRRASNGLYRRRTASIPAVKGLDRYPTHGILWPPGPPSVNKNSLATTQFVSLSINYTKRTSIIKTLSVALLLGHITASEQ